MTKSRNLIKIAVVGFFIVFSVGFGSEATAGELMYSADPMEGQSWQISAYGRRVEADPVVEINGVNAIKVPTSAGSSTIFADSNTEVELKAEYEAAVAALTVRPREGLHYRVKIGQIRDFEVHFPSGSVTNDLRSQGDGTVWGVGVRWNLSPASMVSVASALDISYTMMFVNLDRFESGGVVTSTDQDFSQDEVQVALNLSRRWARWEPFGGLKISRVVSELKDRTTKEEVKGTLNGVSPFIGVKVEFFEKEFLIIEASFVDEESVSAGLAVNF